MFPYKIATIDSGFAFINNIKSLNLNFIAGCFFVGVEFLGHRGPVPKSLNQLSQTFLNWSYFNVLYRSYRVKNKVIDVLYILLLYWNFVCSVMRRVGFVCKFICRKPTVTCTNDQGLTNIYGSIVFHI